MAYFISEQDSIKGKDPNANYTNKHITFNNGEYVEHLEPTIEDIEEEKNLYFWANPDAHTTNSITT